MFAGFQMAQGRFLEKHYIPGDYTNFIIGGILVIVALVFILIIIYGLPNFNFNFNMGKFSAYAIRSFSIIGLILSFLFFVIFLVKNNVLSFMAFYSMTGSLLAYGFSYVIEAACKYLERYELKESEDRDCE